MNQEVASDILPTWARMAAFCPAVTRMACCVTSAGFDGVWPAEVEALCFPELCADWPTRKVPWRKKRVMRDEIIIPTDFSSLGN